MLPAGPDALARTVSAECAKPCREVNSSMPTVYRADHCGSLIRPTELKEARAAWVRGNLDADALREAEDRAILDVIEMQRSAGLDVYSDGEFRRGFWQAAVSEEFIAGLENEGVDYTRHPYLKGKEVEDADLLIPPNPIVTGKLGLRKRITETETAFLKAHAPGPFKITIPSPVTLSRNSFKPGVTDRVYPSWGELFHDYAGVIAEEIGAIAADGVPYIQLDAPHYTRFIVPERRAQLTQFGIDLDKELTADIEAENRCLAAGRSRGATVAVHICLGTFVLGAPGPTGGAGDYDEAVIGRLFRELDADIFLIEYSERVGGLETLREVPGQKRVSLGIQNVRDPRVETSDEIARKIEVAAGYIDLDRLSLCPNCGFSGGAADSFVTEDIEKRKLEVLAETARRVWG